MGLISDAEQGIEQVNTVHRFVQQHLLNHFP